MYTLFDTETEERENNSAPLAERMRPESIREFLGQSEICADGSLLRRAIMLDKLGSCIFYGPPGTGKTTLARIIANSTSGNFIQLNAVTSGVADVKKVVNGRTAGIHSDLARFNRHKRIFFEGKCIVKLYHALTSQVFFLIISLYVRFVKIFLFFCFLKASFSSAFLSSSSIYLFFKEQLKVV